MLLLETVCAVRNIAIEGIKASMATIRARFGQGREMREGTDNIKNLLKEMPEGAGWNITRDDLQHIAHFFCARSHTGLNDVFKLLEVEAEEFAEIIKAPRAEHRILRMALIWGMNRSRFSGIRTADGLCLSNADEDLRRIVMRDVFMLLEVEAEESLEIIKVLRTQGPVNGPDEGVGRRRGVLRNESFYTWLVNAIQDVQRPLPREGSFWRAPRLLGPIALM